MRRRPSPVLMMLLALGSWTGCGGEASQSADSSSSPPDAAAADMASGGPTERVAADVGVGAKGRSLDGYTDGVEGAIASAPKALFAAKEEIAYNIQVKHALQLYKATNGKGPATHEEFMTEIVEKNRIELPELPPGQKYVYDPEQEQLMVERPRQ